MSKKRENVNEKGNKFMVKILKFFMVNTTKNEVKIFIL